MLVNEKALLDAVAGCPDATSGEIARHLGLPQSNTRRDLKKLHLEGKVVGWNSGDKLGTLRWRLPNVGARPEHSAPTSSGPIIDIGTADYEDTTQPFQSRALVPSQPQTVTRGGVTYNVGPPPSVRRTASGQFVFQGVSTAASPVQPYGGQPVPSVEVAALNDLFLSDGDAAGTIAGIIEQRRRDMALHEAWVRAQHAKQQEEERARKEAEEEQRRQDEIHAAIMKWLTRSWGRNEPKPKNSRAPAHAQSSEPSENWDYTSDDEAAELRRSRGLSRQAGIWTRRGIGTGPRERSHPIQDPAHTLDACPD